LQTVAGEQAWCVVVPHHARAASLARRRLAADLADLDAELVDTARAVVSELVGNAVQHARPLPGGVVLVSWRIEEDVLRVRVTDGGGPGVPRLQKVGPDALRGRGLSIVASLAHRWGVAPHGIGTCVWAELRRVG